MKTLEKIIESALDFIGDEDRLIQTGDEKEKFVRGYIAGYMSAHYEISENNNNNEKIG